LAEERLTIKQAAEQIGVSAITLKRWLLTGRVADVRRDRNGWRVFAGADIERISDYARHLKEPSGPKGSLVRPRTFSVASLFSGIGGLDLGFQRVGFRIALQCDIDPFCLAILAKHWPDVPRLKNIKEVSGADIPVCEVWGAGFPCQDLSLARMGKRKGLQGERSGLFHDFARLVGEGRPRVLLIENVHGLLNSHRGRDLETVVRTLAELGYAVGWRTLNSKDFGVPQSRQRIYIVGCYRDWRGPSAILFEPERSDRDAKTGRPHGKRPISPFKRVLGDPSKGEPVVQSIAYCLYACSARHTGTDWSRTYVCYPKAGKVRRLTPRECEGLMGFPESWTIPPEGLFRESDLDSLRYYALGNAVTPPVAEWLAERISLYLLSTMDAPLPQQADAVAG
jgi:DNA (cytosine-5)-methyltransferase 1